MKKKILFWYKQLACEDGIYMIEASIVIPVTFYCSLVMLFFAMLMYQNVLSSHAATVAAEREAAFWDNSYKDAVSGSYSIGQRDRLYWRLFEAKINPSDKLLNGLLGIATSSVSNTVALPVHGEPTALPEKKLVRAGRLLPPIFRGEMKFDHTMIARKVTVSLDRPLYQTAFRRLGGRTVSAEGEATASVVEPVEFIRSMEGARYMITKLDQWKKKGISKGKVVDVLKRAANTDG